MRDRFAHVAREWQAAGLLRPGLDPVALAQLMLSITLGFVPQRSLAGGADADAHVAALDGLLGERPPPARPG